MTNRSVEASVIQLVGTIILCTTFINHKIQTLKKALILALFFAAKLNARFDFAEYRHAGAYLDASWAKIGDSLPHG